MKTEFLDLSQLIINPLESIIHSIHQDDYSTAGQKAWLLQPIGTENLFPHFEFLLEKTQLIKKINKIIIEIPNLPLGSSPEKNNLIAEVTTLVHWTHLINLLYEFFHNLLIQTNLPKPGKTSSPDFWIRQEENQLKAISGFKTYNILIAAISNYNQKELAILCTNIFGNMEAMDPKIAPNVAPKQLNMFEVGCLEVLIIESNIYKEKHRIATEEQVLAKPP